MHDVIIVGGGPAGLSAALTLGRARKRVLLCDAGPRRNQLATHIHNFVTRDGTPPDEFRRIAREQLAHYPTVEIVDEAVASIEGERNAFRVGSREARRILLATGMVDELPPIEGFAQLWGHAIFQCPYCHGYEVRDRRWGFLVQPAAAAHAVPFARMIRGWTSDVTVFTGGLDVPAIDGVRVERAPIAHLIADGTALKTVALADGTQVPCDVLFTQPPQRQTALVQSLNLALEDGYVVVDPMLRQTSRPGIFASGDLSSRMQAAVAAAAAGMQAAAGINVDLALD